MLHARCRLVVHILTRAAGATRDSTTLDIVRLACPGAVKQTVTLTVEL